MRIKGNVAHARRLLLWSMSAGWWVLLLCCTSECPRVWIMELIRYWANVRNQTKPKYIAPLLLCHQHDKCEKRPSLHAQLLAHFEVVNSTHCIFTHISLWILCTFAPKIWRILHRSIWIVWVICWTIQLLKSLLFLQLNMIKPHTFPHCLFAHVSALTPNGGRV